MMIVRTLFVPKVHKLYWTALNFKQEVIFLFFAIIIFWIKGINSLGLAAEIITNVLMYIVSAAINATL